MTDVSEKLLKCRAAELTRLEFDCECGRTHEVNIGALAIGRGASDDILEYAKPYLHGKTLLVADVNTYAVLGEKTEKIIADAGYDIRSYVFGAHHLIPDVTTLGTLLVEASEEPLSLLLAVGSGTVNDTVRYISHRLGIPYITMATAPSMDGYCGSSSAIVCRRGKETFRCSYAQAVICDTEIMAAAPKRMLYAGFGDVAGKYIALADWKLSHEVTGEYYCPLIARFMARNVEECVAASDGIPSGDVGATGKITEALCLAGIAMSLSGVTRPASGSEHHLTHFVDLDNIRNGRDYELHGLSVGVFSSVMARFYELMREGGYTRVETPSYAHMRNLMRRIGAPSIPSELGISREQCREALLNAKDLRPRYSVLKYAFEKNILEQHTNKIISELYD